VDVRQLARIDLNLLVALQVLIEECNVSKAAERLFITQSAMSKTLLRLRELFQDPLFTRSSHGMVPTPHALEIQKKLILLLQDVQGLVTSPEFNPVNFRGELKLAIPEIIGMAILPKLMEKLQEESPHLKLITITRVEHQLEKLSNGDLDIAVHIKHKHYGTDFILEPVTSLRRVLLVRKGHPLCDLSSSKEAIKQLSSFQLVRWYVSDLNELEAGALIPENKGNIKLGEVVFETSHLFSAIEVVKRTNCLLFGPQFITRHPQLSEGLADIPLKSNKGEIIHYMLAMHRRVEGSPMHQSIRSKIIEIIAELNKKEVSGNPYSGYHLRV
jgi:DNA-binding transcriptional LysR family regulator|tara:strand:+ start:437 stop:1420 length:984 start_codon:yes stop_codon:yes gene_type:complete